MNFACWKSIFDHLVFKYDKQYTGCANFDNTKGITNALVLFKPSLVARKFPLLYFLCNPIERYLINYTSNEIDTFVRFWEYSLQRFDWHILYIVCSILQKLRNNMQGKHLKKEKRSEVKRITRPLLAQAVLRNSGLLSPPMRYVKIRTGMWGQLYRLITSVGKPALSAVINIIAWLHWLPWPVLLYLWRISKAVASAADMFAGISSCFMVLAAIFSSRMFSGDACTRLSLKHWTISSAVSP